MIALVVDPPNWKVRAAGFGAFLTVSPNLIPTIGFAFDAVDSPGPKAGGGFTFTFSKPNNAVGATGAAVFVPKLGTGADAAEATTGAGLPNCNGAGAD